MTFQVSEEAALFLAEVQRLGMRGQTQDEIAAAFGMTQGGLRYRLSQLGFKPEPGNVLRALGSGELYTDLLARGEIVTAPAVERFPDREPAAA
ncbi:MAG: hypothetical protein Q7R32_12200 [Dehalococcoidia bacterium]|nr:hypothetical protein [Dehalococcoidia bacterium]